MSAQSNHTRRPNGTATFSVCVEIVRVSGLRHGMPEVVSSNLLAPTLQSCVVRTLTFWLAGQSDHHRGFEERRQLRPDTLETGRHISTKYYGDTP